VRSRSADAPTSTSAARRTITTIAGTGQTGFSGEHGPATKMELYDPGQLTVDNRGLLCFTDYFNHRVWALRYRDK
jgi:hypothetical protein